jgi:hypothetical protein
VGSVHAARNRWRTAAHCWPTTTPPLIQADAADPASIFVNPVTREFIDFEQPFAVLLSGILHHLTDEQDPPGITAYIKSRMTSGSYLLVTNFLDDDNPRAREVQEIINNGFGTGFFRTWEQQRVTPGRPQHEGQRLDHLQLRGHRLQGVNGAAAAARSIGGVVGAPVAAARRPPQPGGPRSPAPLRGHRRG